MTYSWCKIKMLVV